MKKMGVNAQKVTELPELYQSKFGTNTVVTWAVFTNPTHKAAYCLYSKR